MSSTGHPSSSRQKEKAPLERLTPLEVGDAEIANIWRVIEQLQGSVMELQAEMENFKAEKASWGTLPEELAMKDKFIEELNDELETTHETNQELANDVESKDQIIQTLSSDLDRRDAKVELLQQEVDHYKQRPDPLQEQSGSSNRAEELEFQKTSSDATEDEFETVTRKKNTLALDPGSKATINAGSAFSENLFRAIDPEDPMKKKRGPKKYKGLNPRPVPVEPRYVSPPETVKAETQSRAGFSAPRPRFRALSPPETSSPLLSRTRLYGNRPGFDTLHPKAHAFVPQAKSAPQAPNLALGSPNSPQPEDVRSLANRNEAESIRGYNQVAATPARPNSNAQRDDLISFLGMFQSSQTVKADLEKRVAELRQELPKTSKPGADQTRSIGGSSNPRDRQVKAATLSDKLLESVGESLGSGRNAPWSDDVDDDGDIEMTSISQESVLEDARVRANLAATRSLFETPSTNADRAPQTSAKSYRKIAPKGKRDGSAAAMVPPQPIDSSKLQDQASQEVSGIGSVKDKLPKEEGDKSQSGSYRSMHRSLPGPDTPLPPPGDAKEPHTGSQQVEQGTGSGNATTKTDIREVSDGRNQPASASKGQSPPQDNMHEQTGSAEIGPDNKTSPAKDKEQATHAGTDRLTPAPGGPLIPPGHIHKPKSDAEGSYVAGSKSNRRRKRERQKRDKVILQAGGGGVGDDGTKGDLSGSRRRR